MAESQEPRGLVELPGAGIPADHGLSSLGLLMQLAGRTTAALTALVAMMFLLAWRDLPHVTWLIVICAGSIGRSTLHCAAGRELIYPSRPAASTRPFVALRLYILAGIAHAILIGAMAPELGAAQPTAIGLAFALAVWPLLLTVVLRYLRGSIDVALPLGEDRGLEGASVLMLVFGALGAVLAVALLFVIGSLRAEPIGHGWPMLLGWVFALLAIRAPMQLVAGLAGLAAGATGWYLQFERFGEVTARYTRFGLLSAVGVGAVLIAFLPFHYDPATLLGAIAVTWLLLAWPRTLRGFLDDRRLGGIIEGGRVDHRRAPDAGLTALGWLLVGHAAIATSVLALLTAHPEATPLRRLGAELFASIVGRGSDGVILSAGVIGLELLAASALIRMADHRRLFASVYAGIAIAVTLALSWPTIGSFEHHRRLWVVLALIPAACQLVVPLATLLLVHRRVEAGAHARYRRL